MSPTRMLYPTTALGRRLRELRVERNYTLREVSRHAQVTAAYLSLVEMGKARPSEYTLTLLAAALATDAVELLCLAGTLPATLVDWLTAKPARVRSLLAEAGLTPPDVPMLL